MMIFLKVYYISAGQTILASVSREENCIIIIRQFTALASSASVMQISGGSTPLAKERARIFFVCFVLFFCFFVFGFFGFFACAADFSSFCDFISTQRALLSPPLDPPLQMDKYKEISSGFDVYSVEVFNVLYHVYKHLTT